jgi:hypothetical protein
MQVLETTAVHQAYATRPDGSFLPVREAHALNLTSKVGTAYHPRFMCCVRELQQRIVFIALRGLCRRS